MASHKMSWIEVLRPLHKKLGAIQRGDWLHLHDEAGQTLQQYQTQPHVDALGTRNVLYLQPIGLTESHPIQTTLLQLTAQFLEKFYGLKVVLYDDFPLKDIPEKDSKGNRVRRTHPSWGDKQILTKYILKEILEPRLPQDAAALLALTPIDLFPAPDWNFVFGEASLSKRVGVWSSYRNGDPTQGNSHFKLCLLRTLKTATHETGHMFGMHHCTAYECLMCGSNHQEESDRRPLEVCPECVGKVVLATGVDPTKRFKDLMEYCEKNGFVTEKEFYERSLQALSSAQTE